MSRVGHVPIRTCLGCGTRAPKAEMLRIVLDADGQLTPDVAQRCAGRGGYLHHQPTCRSGFAARKGIVRSLKVTADRAARAAFVAKITQAMIVEA